MTVHPPVNWSDDQTPGVECLTCGHVQPTAEGRCPRCGKALTQLQKQTPGAISYQRSAISEPTADSRQPITDNRQPTPDTRQPIVLPNTPAARRFIQAAQAVEADLAQRVQDDVTRLAQAQKSVTAIQEQTHQDNRAVQAFRGLLQAVRVSDDRPKPKADRRPPTADHRPPTADNRWSPSYDACLRCGRTTIKHLARGYCRSCYAKAPKEER